MEIGLGLLGSIWMLLVPGLPLALVLAGRTWTWWEVGAVSAPLSLVLNFAFLQVLNRVGLTPNLRTYALALTVIVALVSWRLLQIRSNLPGPTSSMMAMLLPPSVALLFWGAAFRGFSPLAANQDAINHNLWISRIADTGSVLGPDVRVQSPLQDRVADAGFYPLAWHAEAGSGAALFGIPAPAISLVSTFVFWSLVLTLGLVALCRKISDDGVLLGITSALIAQSVPLLPGVPMTWGAMTTVVGVAMLPATLFSLIYFFEAPGISSSMLVGLLGVSLFFAHSPEAATAVIIAALAAVVQGLRGQLAKRTVMLMVALAGGGLISAVAAYSTISSLAETLEGLLGGNERNLNESIGSFITLSINVPTTQVLFGALVACGLWLSATMIRGPWIGIAILSCFAVYVLSGANSEPLVRFRGLTAPWYGSYERTAWVAVPFLTILAALPIVSLLVASRGQGRRTVLPVAISCILMSGQAWLGGQATVEQLRKGVAENQVAGPGSRTLFKQASRLALDDGLILSEGGDGSLYANIYDDVPVSNGAFDVDGKSSTQLGALLAGLHDLCSVPDADRLLQRYKVRGILLGTRQIASSAPAWTELEVRAARGMTILGRSRDLFLLAPDLDACR